MPPTENKPPVIHITNQSKEGVGPIIGAIVVVGLLAFGALYFWGQQLNKEEVAETPVIQGEVSL
jgi:hypothetical protein